MAVLGTYQRGDAATLSITFFNAADPPVAADPNAVALTVTRPDESAVVLTYAGGEIVRVTTGLYRATLALTIPGVWQYRWQGSGGLEVAEEGQLVVTWRRWTYSGNPAGSPRDEVRFLVGDINPNDGLLDDAEIAYALTRYSTPQLAAAFLAERLAAAASRFVSISIGGISISAAEKARSFAALAENLRNEAAALASPGGAAAVAPVFTGHTLADRASAFADPERVPLMFETRPEDEPRP